MTVQQDRNEPGSHCFGCRLGNKHIAIDASISPSSIFGQGVVTIHRSGEAAMTVNEKFACRKLLLENATDGVGLESESILAEYLRPSADESASRQNTSTATFSLGLLLRLSDCGLLQVIF